MKRYINRGLLAVLGTLLAMWLLPMQAAGQTYPRILRLTMGIPNSCIRLYFAASLEDALLGNAVISRVPSREELDRVLQAQNLAAEVIADEAGEAAVNFSDLGLRDGVYLVTGKDFAPFYVCVPEPDGDHWIYNVQVYPGYRIGGEAEPMPTAGETVNMTAESVRSADGQWGGVLLVMAAGGAFVLHLHRTGIC